MRVKEKKRKYGEEMRAKRVVVSQLKSYLRFLFAFEAERQQQQQKTDTLYTVSQ